MMTVKLVRRMGHSERFVMYSVGKALTEYGEHSVNDTKMQILYDLHVFGWNNDAYIA